MPDSASDDTAVVTSTEPSTDTTQSTTNSDSTIATSSTAEKPAETLLDRIHSIVRKPGESPSSEKPGSTADADSPVTTAKPDESLELPADEAKNLHPKTTERFKGLTSKLKAATAEVETLKPKAAEFDKIDTFIKNAGLSSQDVGSTLQIAAMLRSDPRAARERLQPIMAELNRILGEELPPEIQARVDQGYLTAEDAKALSRAAADATLAKKQVTAVTERQQQEEASRTQQAAIDSTLNAIDTWEKTKAKGDPDWHTKQIEVSQLVELAITRKTQELKRPYWPTPAEAVQLSDDALKEVAERHKRFAPKPRSIAPPVSTDASPRSAPAPKNTLDIVRQLAGRTS